MSKKKDLKKSLKQPDAFQSSVVSGLDRAMEYKGVIFGALAVIVVGTVGLAFYQYNATQQISKRVNALGKIEEAFEKENESHNEARNKIREEIGKLTAPGDDGKPKKLNAADEKRKTELQKKVGAMVADHSGSLAQYQAFYNANKDFAEGWMAGTRATNILLDQKKYSEAKAIMAEIVARSSDNFFYQINGRLLYINILDELSEFDAAIAEADKLLASIDRIDAEAKSVNKEREKEKAAQLDNPAESLKPQALLTKGRLLIRKGSKEEAAKVFDKIVADFKDSNEARQAGSYKALLL